MSLFSGPKDWDDTPAKEQGNDGEDSADSSSASDGSDTNNQSYAIQPLSCIRKRLYHFYDIINL